MEADYDEAVWYKIVSGNKKITIGLVYRSPSINEEDYTQIQNAVKEVTKGECIIMGDKKTYKRNFHKGNYKDMRKYLAKLDWNNLLMNKTAIQCWNILKY